MTDNLLEGRTSWPDIDVAAWAPTKRTFHLCAQMLGKLRVALSPVQPNWMFTALLLSARGITTGTIPWRETSLQASLDIFSSEIIVELSDGNSERIPISPERTVADIYTRLQTALKKLRVECTISPIPQEITDITPLPQDRRPAVYDPDAVLRWFQAATATAGIFERWRTHFFGRTGIQVWWGALDVALLLFNGKHAAAPSDRGFIMKYDLDAQMMNAGLFYGDETTPPFFYGYIFPQPAGAEKLAIGPSAASWSEPLKEWLLPYDDVRHAADPSAQLHAFLDSIYGHCIQAAGWDRDGLSYIAPKMRAPKT
ncbi:MAG: DUF5996 family protein [Candidatus Eremiobacteraeota bacterium]|nr:DUF5996 family protein [Candidatus Eremiobacteraeota bacterium]